MYSNMIWEGVPKTASTLINVQYSCPSLPVKPKSPIVTSEQNEQTYKLSKQRQRLKYTCKAF